MSASKCNGVILSSGQTTYEDEMTRKLDDLMGHLKNVCWALKNCKLSEIENELHRIEKFKEDYIKQKIEGLKGG